MLCLTDRSCKTSNSDPIAAHHRRVHEAIFINILHVHAFGIFCAKLEDISHFNPALDRQGWFSAARADTAILYFRDIVIRDICKISFQIQTGIMESLFVCTCYQAIDPFQWQITVISNLIRKHVRSDISGNQWRIRCNFSRMDLFSDEIAEFCLVYFIIPTDKCNHIAVIRISLIYHCLTGF